MVVFCYPLVQKEVSDMSFYQGKNFELCYPDKKYATDLFWAIDNDRTELEKWLPWVKETNTVKDEENFLKYVQAQNEQQKMLALTIIVDKTACGMIDLHALDLNAKTAEIGYWLASPYQHQGIITVGAEQLVQYALTKLGLVRVGLLADVRNISSLRVAKRLGFKPEGVLRSYLRHNGQNIDVYSFSKLNTD